MNIKYVLIRRAPPIVTDSIVVSRARLNPREDLFTFPALGWDGSGERDYIDRGSHSSQAWQARVQE